MKLSILKINSVQGVVLLDGEVVGAFHDHSKKLYFNYQYKGKFTLPKQIREYEVVDEFIDCFTLSMFTDNGSKEVK
jgi:hypothetical protein